MSRLLKGSGYRCTVAAACSMARRTASGGSNGVSLLEILNVSISVRGAGICPAL